MTTPDPNAPGASAAADSDRGAWGAVARLLSLQLLTVIAVTAVITGIYAASGGRNVDQATVGSSAPATSTTGSKPPGSKAPGSKAPSTKPPSTKPPGSKSPSPGASAAPPASPTPSQPPPEAAARLKVDVLNQSGGSGTAAKIASHVRALGWTVGHVTDFNGNVSATTVYYPTGEATAAHDLASALPGAQRVLPRFSTLAGTRLTIIIVG